MFRERTVNTQQDQPSPGSVLEAIKMGLWDFEPEDVPQATYQSTVALPGTKEKLEILAERARRGLPLWHESDRRCFQEHGDEA